MIRLIAIIIVALAGCSHKQPEDGGYAELMKTCSGSVSNPQYVSIAALLGNPDRYEGRAVWIRGYLHASFEHRAIYLSELDYKHYVTTNGIWVEGNIPEGVNDEYASIVGIFTTKSKGHLGAWSGSICGATKIRTSQSE